MGHWHVNLLLTTTHTNPLPQGLDSLHGSVHLLLWHARFLGHSTLLVQVLPPGIKVLGTDAAVVVTENGGGVGGVVGSTEGWTGRKGVNGEGVGVVVATNGGLVTVGGGTEVDGDDLGVLVTGGLGVVGGGGAVDDLGV